MTFFGILLVAGFSLIEDAYALTSLTDCATLDIPGETYVLESNVASTDHCFFITADNVTLDGNNYVVTGTAVQKYAVFTAGTSGGILTNIVIENFERGIVLENSHNYEINNNDLHSNKIGLYLRQSSDNTVQFNTVNFNSNTGIISSFQSHRNIFENNVLNSNTRGGIAITQESDDNIVFDNSLSSNGGNAAILVDQSLRPIIEDNVITDNFQGMMILRSSDGTIIENSITQNFIGANIGELENFLISQNTIESNTWHGLSATLVDNSMIVNNSIQFNGRNGLTLSVSNDNSITENILSNNSDNWSGMELITSNNNIISDNEINSNGGGIGILNSNNNEIFQNLIQTNSIHGLRISPQHDSDDNLIYNNNFIDNPIQARDDNSGNFFNAQLPDGGNYWNNFDEPAEGCDDINNDGFCDVAYVFVGGRDNFPLVEPIVDTTPTEQIEDLISIVLDLPDNSKLKANQVNGLLAKLNDAIDSIEGNEIQDAINQLEAFINQVSAFEKANKIIEEQANSLIDYANNVIQQLES